jgi:hypothetical protein
MNLCICILPEYLRKREREKGRKTEEKMRIKKVKEREERNNTIHFYLTTICHYTNSYFFVGFCFVSFRLFVFFCFCIVHLVSPWSP